MKHPTVSSGSKSVSTIDHVFDAVCDEFERELQAGRVPELAVYLDRVESAKRKALFRELVQLECWYFQQAGIASRLENHRAQFHQYADVLEELRRETSVPLSSAATLTPGLGGDTVTTSTRYVDLRDRRGGGLGEVFRATDEELRRDAAVKFMRRRCSRDPLLRQKFLVEAEVTGRLDHPGVVPVYGRGESWDGRPFYVMRFIPGADLAEEIRRYHESADGDSNGRSRRLRFHELLGHLISACETVAYAHSRGVLHCDLKPANIRVGRYGETIVVDWGLANLVERNPEDKAGGEATLRVDGLADSPVDSGGAFGTPSYMSPEQTQLCAAPVTQASDIYSLGATLYTLLTGAPPFPPPRSMSQFAEVEERIVRGDFLRPRQIDSTCPRCLEAICLKAMATQPAQRYRTAQELARDLRSWMADRPVAAYAEPLRDRLARWARRHSAWFLAAVCTAVLVLMMCVAWSARESSRARHEAQLRRRADEARLTTLQTSAMLAAVAYGGEMGERWRILTRLAEHPELPDLLRAATAAEEGSAAWRDLQAWLQEATSEYPWDRRSTCFFMNDAKSRQVARVPPGETIGDYFGYRAYFHGGPEDLPETPRSAWQDKTPTDRPVLSPPFQSKTDDWYKVAFSVPVPAPHSAGAETHTTGDESAPLGILAMSVQLPDLAACIENKLPREDLQVILVNLGTDQLGSQSRDGLVLDHPNLVPGNSHHPAARKPPPRLSDRELLGRLRRLHDIAEVSFRRSGQPPEESEELKRLSISQDFPDPLAREHHGCIWAAFWPVFVQCPGRLIDTQWIVVVEAPSSRS